jgi:peptide/nickel transport system substrate-binding protein
MAGPSLAQKSGGVLKIQHMDTPPSASIHEEGTVSTVVPFMGLYNNLVMFDQNVARNSLDSIVPDLATSWTWSDDGKHLSFKLRQGVTWHDGKPFTAKDVACTFDLLTDPEKLRRSPRAAWWGNLDKVTVESDFDVTLHLKRRQPAFLALVASGYTPIYPCHIPTAEMRRKPIGTGPFKLVESDERGHQAGEEPQLLEAEGGPISTASSTIIPDPDRHAVLRRRPVRA